MRVEQICRTVQRHGGFAGTRSTLHHHGLVEVGANNAILLGLDGCHDIGHLAGALGVQRCEQRAFAGQSAVRRRLPDLVGVHIEHFVFNADHFTEAECDMAAHYDIAMIGRRRFVERTCRVGSPIGEDRLVVFVGQSDTPDVSVRTVDIVESAEHQAIFDGTQLGEAILVHGGEGIAFGALRGRSVRAGSTHGVETGTSLGPQIIQAAVRAADGLLFFTQLGGITRHLQSLPHKT